MIEARYHDSVNVLQALFEGEGALEARSPFDRAEWYALLAETGLKPLVATASDNDTQAALALIEDNGRIATLRNWYSFAFRPLVPDGERGDRMLVQIARELRTRSYRVTLEPIPEEDGSATRLANAFRTAGWRVEVTRCDTNHYLDVDGRSFADYWASRPGPLRTTLKRKAKKVETRILSSFDAGAWGHYERIYDASWKPEEGKPAMLRKFAEQEGAAGRLRLGLAMLDNEPIAAQFWTVEGSVAYIHKLAHLEEHTKLSAGTTLTAALFEHAIDRDAVKSIDFGTGTQPYKSDWMEETRYRYKIDCLDMRQPRAWFDLARLAVQRLRHDDWLDLAPGPLPS